jgi:hypothetical protein
VVSRPTGRETHCFKRIRTKSLQRLSPHTTGLAHFKTGIQGEYQQKRVKARLLLSGSTYPIFAMVGLVTNSSAPVDHTGLVKATDHLSLRTSSSTIGAVYRFKKL